MIKGITIYLTKTELEWVWSKSSDIPDDDLELENLSRKAKKAWDKCD